MQHLEQLITPHAFCSPWLWPMFYIYTDDDEPLVVIAMA